MGQEGGEGSSGLYRSGAFYSGGGQEVLIVTQLEVGVTCLGLGPISLLEVDNRVVVTHVRAVITGADVLHSWAGLF